MQPNLKIKLHIVAPESRRDKLLREIRRPVFMRLEGGALADTCIYLSYDMVADIRGQVHLKRLSDKVLDDYEEKNGKKLIDVIPSRYFDKASLGRQF